MSKNINIISEDVCTGCGACNNCCPVDAIEMLEDQEGFKYPNIDMDKCISCGKCINVCPEANVERINQNLHEEPECYAAMADTTIRIKKFFWWCFRYISRVNIPEKWTCLWSCLC